MRICFVATHFPILGRSTDRSFLWPLAKGLVHLGHSVHVITMRSSVQSAGSPNFFRRGDFATRNENSFSKKLSSSVEPVSSESSVRDGVHVHSLSAPGGFREFADSVTQKFLELHQQEKFDLVHALDRRALKLAKRKKRWKFKVAFDVDATQMAQIFSILAMNQESVRGFFITTAALVYKFLSTYFVSDRDIVHVADGIFVATPQQKIFLERYYLYPEAKTYLVPYGLELGSFQTQSILEVRKQLQLASDFQVVLCLTDFSETESLSHVLKAFEAVAIKKPNARLVFIGQGPEFNKVQRMTLDRALGSRVLMTGPQSLEEISSWIVACDVYLDLSYRSSGFDPTLLEAMAQKKIVIGSEVGPVSAVVEEGEDGFLLKPADSKSLAQLLIDCFSGSIPLQEIGEKARAKVVQLFEPKRMVEELQKSYQSILSG